MWYGIIRFGAAIVEFSSLSGDSVFWTSAAAHFISQLHKNIWNFVPDPFTVIWLFLVLECTN